MSTQSYILNNQPGNVLYQAGRITATLDFSLTSKSFRSFTTIDLSKLDPKKLSIFIFGQVNDDFDGTIPPKQHYVLQPRVSGAFYDYTARLDSHYQLVNGILSIGVLNIDSLSDAVPTTPYLQAVIDYFIFYY